MTRTPLLFTPPSASPALAPSAAVLRGSWYGIDLGAIRHNYRQLRSQLPPTVRIFACLKRNAYGCGASEVAKALGEEGADGFAVASLLDAIAIRGSGLKQPILLYPGPGTSSAETIGALDLTMTISSLDELEQWCGALPTLRIFVKVDLGFFRAGATPSQAVPLLAAAARRRNVKVEGIYAHMSEFPGRRHDDARDQLDRMQKILRGAASLGLRPEVAMMSSSEAVLAYPDMDFDAVDPGALFFGLSEGDRPVRDISLRPALKTIAANLVSVKRLDASLGPTPDIFGLKPGMTIGVLGIGWGDGMPRQLPSTAAALVAGKRARLLGPVHLEHVRIDLSDVPNARFGDEVVLLGRQGSQSISHEEACRTWGTDPIGLYGQLRDHIPRIYT